MTRAQALAVIAEVKRVLADAESALEQTPDTADVDSLVGGTLSTAALALTEAAKVAPEEKAS